MVNATSAKGRNKLAEATYETTAPHTHSSGRKEVKQGRAQQHDTTHSQRIGSERQQDGGGNARSHSTPHTTTTPHKVHVTHNATSHTPQYTHRHTAIHTSQ
jgi:hypothetical protein